MTKHEKSVVMDLIRKWDKAWDISSDWGEELTEENAHQMLIFTDDVLNTLRGWQPIANAPKDDTPVDLWRGEWKERATNMRRVELSKDNIFYEPICSGPGCVRDATHFMLVPGDPDV
jgi:hypothetical protein